MFCFDRVDKHVHSTQQQKTYAGTSLMHTTNTMDFTQKLYININIQPTEKASPCNLRHSGFWRQTNQLWFDAFYLHFRVIYWLWRMHQSINYAEANWKDSRLLLESKCINWRYQSRTRECGKTDGLSEFGITFSQITHTRNNEDFMV